jgi:hypothetical protein
MQFSILIHLNDCIICNGQVSVHAPMTEILSTLDRNQLQKLLQYAVDDDPAGVLGKVFRHVGVYLIQAMFIPFFLFLKLSYNYKRELQNHSVLQLKRAK